MITGCLRSATIVPSEHKRAAASRLSSRGTTGDPGVFTAAICRVLIKREPFLGSRGVSWFWLAAGRVVVVSRSSWLTSSEAERPSPKIVYDCEELTSPNSEVLGLLEVGVAPPVMGEEARPSLLRGKAEDNGFPVSHEGTLGENHSFPPGRWLWSTAAWGPEATRVPDCVTGLGSSSSGRFPVAPTSKELPKGAL